MDEKTRQQFGLLLTNQDKLLDVLSHSVSQLDDYPDLQAFLAEKNACSVAYRKALREKKFSKQDYKIEILSCLDWIGYEVCLELDLDFLVNKVASQVGDDIEAIKHLSVKELGVDNLSKLLHKMGNAVHASVEEKPSYPFLATKGQMDPRFWKQAHRAFDAYQSGYSTHWKLNSWCKDTLDVTCPQSAIRFFKREGNPRLVSEWVTWSGWQPEVD